MARDVSEIARFQRYVREELDAAWMYERLAAAERNASRRTALFKLAAAERRHAEHWLTRLRALGATPDTSVEPSFRSRWLGWMARLFGPRSVLPIVVRLERADASRYDAEPGAEALATEEREHLEVAAQLSNGTATTSRTAITSGSELARREGRHKSDTSGSLRAATFGISDGLASNFSLVMGVAGAEPDTRFILLAGIAGLLAGAFSMAAGEYVSMGVQREMFENEIDVERRELEENPAEEAEELSLIYQAKGVPPDQAEALALTLMRDPKVALDALAREELGLDPDALGSPWGAAISSFISFAIGAAVPVLPFLFLGGHVAVLVSVALACTALFTAGAATTLVTGKPFWFGGLRLMLIASAAAGVTWLVGRLIGVSVA